MKQTSFHFHGFWWHLNWIDGRNAIDQFKENWYLHRGWIIHEHNRDLRFKLSEVETKKIAA